jgi:hypothetical protein
MIDGKLNKGKFSHTSSSSKKQDSYLPEKKLRRTQLSRQFLSLANSCDSDSFSFPPLIIKIGNYSGRHKGAEYQRHKVERSEENELLKI